MTRRRPAAALCSAALLAACGGEPTLPPRDATVDATLADASRDAAPDASPLADASLAADVAVDASLPPPVCTPLVIDPARMRIATGGGAYFRTTGGSGRGALFTLAPGALTGGATITVGGGVLGGAAAASFEVVAADMMCNATARGRVEVVGPFVVEPTEVRVAPGRTLGFMARGSLGPVRWDLLQQPDGGNGAVDPMTGAFTTGTVAGIYRVRALDTLGSSEVQATVTVASGTTFAPASTTVLVPRGRRVRLDWRGGSGFVNASITGGMAGGAIAGDAGQVLFDATAARPGSATVSATDRYTNERVTVRVVVGDELAPAPVARGPVNFAGDLGLGDVNGDGRQDLVLGHGNRSENGNETGGVLVYLGQADGSFRATPDQVLNGERDNDLFGANVAVLDVDGDRIDDVVVGSPNQDLGRDARGSVQVFLGSRGPLVTPPERTFVGENNGDAFGTSMLLEDLDRDGAKDLVVAAPSGANSFNAACGRSGRVYVYRSTPGLRGLFLTVPWQVLDVRDRLDDADGTPQCRPGSGPGTSMALLDVDGDGFKDLAIGAPGAGPPNFGSVIFYRGTARGNFEETPAWVIHTAASQRVNNPRFGFGLDVVRTSPSEERLVVRVPTFGQNAAGAPVLLTGGFLTFAPGTFGAPPGGGTVRVLTTEIARARFSGSATNEQAGRAGALGDVDGDGDNDYVVGSGAAGLDGAAYVFEASALGVAGTLTPTSTVRGEVASAEALGARVAIGRAPAGMSAPVAVLSSYRTTRTVFGGAVRWLPQGAPRAWMDRWAAGSWLDVPVLPAFDRSGTAVALGALRGAAAGDLVVGSPGAHSPLVPAAGLAPERPAGFRARTGAADVFRASDGAQAQRYWVDRTAGGLGAAMAVLDFDGDGRMDLALGDPGDTSGGTDMIRRVTPNLANAASDPCWLRTGGVVATTSAARGLVKIYLQGADGALTERFWAIPAESVAAGGTARRAGFGFSLAPAGDVNGDGVADLLVGRAGGGGNNGAEVIFGQGADAMGRIRVVCADADAAPYWDARADGVVFGVGVAGVGDLDSDGCAETAASITGGGRAGLSVQYGFGPMCRRMHRDRHELLVVADDRALRANVTPPGGTPRPLAMRTADWVDLAGAATGFGLVFAGGADLNGDRVPDLAVRDATLQWRDRAGPAVEVLSGAYLNGLCPEHVCPEGLDERFYSDGAGYNVVGVRTLAAPHRVIVPAFSPTSVRFGAALAVSDLDGDGAGDLLVGAADDSSQGAFAGAVMAWRASNDPESFVAPPWLFAVGDVAEASSFGAALSVSREAGGAWLAAGAPLSGHRGAQTGAAYRWRIDR